MALLNVRLMTTTSQSNELLPYETCPHCLILDCQAGRCLALFEECLLRISTLNLNICIEVCKREFRALFDTRCNSRAINLPALPSLASLFRDQGPGVKVPLSPGDSEQPFSRTIRPFPHIGTMFVSQKVIACGLHTLQLSRR